MIFIKLFILFLLSVSLYSKEMYFDTISLSKIKKLIKKEEEIAIAYKKYIIKYASKPNSISSLTNYLPKGFEKKNLFGKTISLDLSKTYIVSEIPSTVKSSLYDKYYSNKNRVYTNAPLSKKNHNIGIVLSEKEKYILNLSTPISKTKPLSTSTTDTYYLDDKGILHWYSLGKIIYSFNENLIVYPDANMVESDGSINNTFKNVVIENNVLHPGQQLLNIEGDIAKEYINIGGDVGIIKTGNSTREIGKTIIQFTRRAGGMVVNGDIYTWGNNANQIVGLGTSTYSGSIGGGNKYPVITGLVRAKAKTYNKKIDDRNYFSSPLRPKFVDFFSTVYHSTCGVTIEGAIYCGGSKGDSFSFGWNFTHVVDAEGNIVGNDDPEMLYRSSFFDGVNNKALKMFANNQVWLILSQDGDIYRWGYDFGKGFSGNGQSQFNYSGYYIQNKNKNPEKINVTENSQSVKFSDITYLLTMGYRKMGALSQDGDIYLWGIEDQVSHGYCNVTWESTSMNLCKPLKVDSSIVDGVKIDDAISFKSISGGLESFVAVSKSTNEFYKVYQPINKKPIVLSVSKAIKDYEEYVEEDDKEILSVDFSSKLDGTTLNWNEGIVWVNGKNELKGDYFTYDNKDDKFF
jgi:hypothetical protein